VRGLNRAFTRPGLTGRNTACQATPKSGVKPPQSKLRITCAYAEDIEKEAVESNGV